MIFVESEGEGVAGGQLSAKPRGRRVGRAIARKTSRGVRRAVGQRKDHTAVNDVIGRVIVPPDGVELNCPFRKTLEFAVIPDIEVISLMDRPRTGEQEDRERAVPQ